MARPLLRLAAFTLLTALTASLAGACGGDVTCAEYCTTVEDCEQDFLAGASCSDFCSQTEQLNEQYDCTDAFQEFINCSDGEDACQPTGCIDEIRAYSDCLQCGIDPEDEDC